MIALTKEAWTIFVVDDDDSVRKALSRLMRGAGFDVQQVKEREMLLDARHLALIGAYGGFAEVLLSGFPVAEASEDTITKSEVRAEPPNRIHDQLQYQYCIRPHALRTY